jgi:glycerol-3-phosphate dehydrogenase
MVFTSDLRGAVAGVEIVLFAIPTQFLRPLLEDHRSTFPVGVPLVQSAKGIEVETLKTPFEVMEEELPGKYGKFLCVLGGPSFAKEMAANLATNVSVASPNVALAEKVQRQRSCRAASFRCYVNVDYLGCEIAGAVKNVLAIASGASSGIGLGLNARAGLICRGLHEMSSLAKAYGSSLEAMAGLAGVGDLMLTCSSELSRNFTVGYRLAKGERLQDIIESTSAVAEGVATAKSVHDLSVKLGVDMPICKQVYAVLYENISVHEALGCLQDRPLSHEHHQ